MDAVIAGWAAGYAMAIATTVALTFLLTRVRQSPLLDRWVASEVPGALLAVPISIGSVVAWTILGVVLGSIYEVASLEDQADGLGSPSGLFTGSMLVLSLFPLAPLLALRPRYWWLWVSMSACFAALFGWALPLLAAR